MPSHNRRQSRGSLSFFAHIRSLSRSGSTQERIPSPYVRSPSGLSCDYLNQPKPRTEQVTPCLLQDHIEVNPSMSTTATNNVRLSSLRLKSRIRPVSWLTFPRVVQSRIVRSFSTQMHKQAKIPASRAVISGPTLVGTTNIDVAEREGVVCGSFIDPRQPEWPGQQLPMSKSTTFGEVVRSMTKKRRPSFDAVTDDARISLVEEGTARRKVETMNLGRDKINKLTGNGQIKRKIVNEKVLPPISHNPQVQTDSADAYSDNDSTCRLNFDSFTNTFVDTTDDSSPSRSASMVFSKSKSIFNLRKEAKEQDRSQKTPPEGMPPRLLQQPIVDKSIKQQLEFEPSDEPKLTLREILAEARAAPGAHGAEDIDVGPRRIFDASTRQFISAEPVRARMIDAHPLRMHPSPMEFVTTPPGFNPSSPQIGQAESIEEDNIIEEAPIYSPSSGDLAQYNRNSSASATLIANRDQIAEQETPTRAPIRRGFRERLGLKKSKSRYGLLEKHEASSDQDQNQENTPVKKTIKKSRSVHFGLFKSKEDTPPSLPENRFFPTTPSPLRAMTSPAEEHQTLIASSVAEAKHYIKQ